jgi:hypothetical protein
MMTWGKTYWPVALIVASLAFLVPEIYALVTNYRNTLSQYAWQKLNVTPHVNVHTVAWTVSLVTWVLFAIIITLHIWGHWE